MRAPEDEAARWRWEWEREGREAIRSSDEETWDLGTELDLAMILGELDLAPRERQVVLDLGCGPGRLALEVARRYRSAWVHGVDICEPVVHAARSVKHHLLPPPANAYFHVGDGRTLPAAIQTGGVDGAYSMLVFQHLEPEAVRGYLAELRRVLRPGARFRFQFCVGESHDLYAQDHDPADVEDWCRSVGLIVLGDEPDDRYSTWRWMTAARPRR